MNNLKELLYITRLEIENLNCSKIRGVTSYWKDKTACITFYFQGEITDDDIEIASDACTYIIAQFPDGLLEENYIRLDYPKPLPSSPYWGYKRQ